MRAKCLAQEHNTVIPARVPHAGEQDMFYFLPFAIFRSDDFTPYLLIETFFSPFARDDNTFKHYPR